MYGWLLPGKGFVIFCPGGNATRPQSALPPLSRAMSITPRPVDSKPLAATITPKDSRLLFFDAGFAKSRTGGVALPLNRFCCVLGANSVPLKA